MFNNIKDPMSVLDKFYQNVIVEKIENGVVTSFTFHNRILPQFVTALMTQAFSAPFSLNANGSFAVGMPLANNIISAVQYGATGLQYLSPTTVTVNIMDPYPSLTIYPNSMSTPLLLTPSASITPVYRSAIDSTNTYQYALIDSYTVITVGNYPYPNGIQFNFTLQSFDMLPSSMNFGNNIKNSITTQSGTYDIFTEIGLIMMPYNVISDASNFTNPSNITQFPICAHIQFDTPMFKNSSIIYNFTWQIWFNY